MKHYKYISFLLFFYLLLLSSCGKNKESTCKNNPGNLDAILEQRYSGIHYSLPPISNYPFIIRYRYSDWSDSHVLTVTKNEDKYFVQLIQDIPSGMPPFQRPYNKPYYMIKEKVLTVEQVDRIHETINDLRCIPAELESAIVGSSSSYFGLVIKISDDVIYFSGFLSDYSNVIQDTYSLKREQNKDKMKVLDFIGFLLRAGEVTCNKKLIYRDENAQTVNDSILYSVSLHPEMMVRNKKVYLDGKIVPDLGAIYDYDTKIKLAYADTLHLKDRIKIKTLEWDNVEVEY